MPYSFSFIFMCLRQKFSSYAAMKINTELWQNSDTWKSPQTLKGIKIIPQWPQARRGGERTSVTSRGKIAREQTQQAGLSTEGERAREREREGGLGTERNRGIEGEREREGGEGRERQREKTQSLWLDKRGQVPEAGKELYLFCGGFLNNTVCVYARMDRGGILCFCVAQCVQHKNPRSGIMSFRQLQHTLTWVAHLGLISASSISVRTAAAAEQFKYEAQSFSHM